MEETYAFSFLRAAIAVVILGHMRHATQRDTILVHDC